MSTDQTNETTEGQDTDDARSRMEAQRITYHRVADLGAAGRRSRPHHRVRRTRAAVAIGTRDDANDALRVR